MSKSSRRRLTVGKVVNRRIHVPRPAFPGVTWPCMVSPSLLLAAGQIMVPLLLQGQELYCAVRQGSARERLSCRRCHMHRRFQFARCGRVCRRVGDCSRAQAGSGDSALGVCQATIALRGDAGPHAADGAARTRQVRSCACAADAVQVALVARVCPPPHSVLLRPLTALRTCCRDATTR